MTSVVVDPGSLSTKLALSQFEPSIFYSQSRRNSFSENSLVKDFDRFAVFLLDKLSSNFPAVDISELNLLCSTPVYKPKKYCQKIGECLFETCDFQGILFKSQPQLALWSIPESLMTGLSVEIGHTHTSVAAIVDGYLSFEDALPLAGQQVNETLRKLLPHSLDIPTINTIKEQVCYVSQNPKKELFRLYQNSQSKYSKIFNFENSPNLALGPERFLGPEVLFDGNYNGFLMSSDESMSLPNLIRKAIEHSPVDYRNKLISSIHLSGGSSLFPGLSRRLENEIPRSKIVPNEVSAEQQALGVIKGAQKLLEYTNFENMVISRQRFQDEGPRVFNSK
jgi:actin-related protein